MTDINLHGQKRMKAVTVSTTPIVLSNTSSRLGLVIRNNDTVSGIYLGRDDTLTAANGFPLLAGEILVDYDAYDRQYGSVDDWYAVASTGSINVRVIEYLG